jgi:hypothetical protein
MIPSITPQAYPSGSAIRAKQAFYHLPEGRSVDQAVITQILLQQDHNWARPTLEAPDRVPGGWRAQRRKAEEREEKGREGQLGRAIVYHALHESVYERRRRERIMQ